MCDRPTTVPIRTVAKMLALTSIGGTHSHATERGTIARAPAAIANRFGFAPSLTMIFLKGRGCPFSPLWAVALDRLGVGRIDAHVDAALPAALQGIDHL